MRARGLLGLILAFSVLTAGAPVAHGANAPEPEQSAIGRTPPRLSFVDGQVSFFRPGAQDWVQAQVNTPLAPGDELSAGAPGSLELQIGARSFVRGWANTQVGLENQEPDFLQFKVTAGHASFDLRALEPGRMVEVDTPNAAFTIEHPGYYRVDVASERASFITRRAGQATVTPASGEAVSIAPNEQVVIEGTGSPQVGSYAAPPLDDWDTWNYARTDALLDAVSARYVSPGTYGVSDLDRYGTWRAVPTYGPIWVPTAVQPGWVPYSTGAWVLDPVYGWTWVDTAPWGWAPYHYGRWVFVDGFWAWAPGPIIARPVYAPALVAFFGGPSVGVNIAIGGPVVGWVALGWGEPCVPWWGPAGFIHRPWWGGWGGPHIVNNVVINKTTVVNVQNITVYRNAGVRNAVVVVNEQHFGHGRITTAHLSQVEVKSLHPIHTAPQVTATPASFVPTASRGIRPPEDSLRRAVVATRPPHPWREPDSERRGAAAAPGISTPAPHLVARPPLRNPASGPPRPPFGQNAVERPRVDRGQPPSSPTPQGPRRPERAFEGTSPVTSQAPPQVRHGLPVASPPSSAPQPLARRPEAPPTPPAHAQPTAPPRREGPGRPEQSSGPPSPVTLQPRPEPRPAGPSSTTPQSLGNHGLASASPRREGPPPVTPHAPAPTQRGPQVVGQPSALPQPAARRAEAPHSPARPLPGEPANRLTPNRAETRPTQHREHPAPPPVRPKSTPSEAPREHPAG